MVGSNQMTLKNVHIQPIDNVYTPFRCYTNVIFPRCPPGGKKNLKKKKKKKKKKTKKKKSKKTKKQTNKQKQTRNKQTKQKPN